MAVYPAYQEAGRKQSATKRGGEAVCELKFDPL